uniref:NADH dehydrogenase subunit 6 n=1 Tax=Endochironomus albipennis TaxID=1051989 RepID=UPI0023F34DA7|nr:NADH dehydrogenase subunit 6 [Endochironomus albipennis]WEF49766.1 NADH dehydrogenase subunit 6 [Endochironomus albipennis]
MMQNFIFFLLIISSMIFSIMNHPLSIGFMLMIQTMLIVIFSGMMIKSFWFSYSLFLIFLGGMLILFMYMTSIASNEEFKFKINFKNLSFMMIYTLMILMFFIFFNQNFLFFNKINNIEILNLETMKMYFLENNFLLNKMYNFPMNLITIMLINYLFLTLIAVVKITNIFEGPMRPKMNN